MSGYLLDVHRLLPQSPDAEMGILGAFLLSPDTTGDLCAQCGISAEHFHIPSHATIFGTLIEHWRAKTPLDFIALTNTLRDRGQLDQCGGPAFITNLFTFLPSAANAGYYAELLRNKWLARRTITLCTEAAARAYDEPESPAQIIAELSANLAALLDAGAENDPDERTMRERVNEWIDHLQTLFDRKEAITGIPLGIKSFDEHTGGAQPGEMWVICGSTKSGKAQPLDAQILTPTGFVAMANIKEGDAIIGSNGRRIRVTGVFPQGVKEVFTVTTSDGGQTQCCEDHLWFTQSLSEQWDGQPGSVKPLKLIMKRVKFSNGRPEHKLPKVKPIVFASTAFSLPIDPYLLGALLGDGCLTSGNVRFFNTEPDIQHRIAMSLHKADCLKSRGDNLTFCIRRKQRNNQMSETAKALAKLGLRGTNSSTKFIPKEYKFASVKERIELLRGLFDTDGCVAAKGVSADFSTCSQTLALDAQFVCRSLGAVTHLVQKVTKCLYKGRTVVGFTWRLGVSFDNGIIPFWSAKNSAKVKMRQKSKPRLIQSIAMAGMKECQCISVDAEDGIYITDDFIPTHNTALAMQAIITNLTAKVPCSIASLEMSTRQLIGRIIASIGRVNGGIFRKPRSFSESDFARITHAGGITGAFELRIHERKRTLSRIAAAIERDVRKFGVRLACIDYAQLVDGERGREENREREVARISATAKQIAVRNNIVVLLLSQTNDDGKLRESRAIGQDADAVLKVRVPVKEDTKPPEPDLASNERTIVVEYARSFEARSFPVTFINPQTRFEDNPSDYET